jgi:preprotein translocase subunit YajC
LILLTGIAYADTTKAVANAAQGQSGGGMGSFLIPMLAVLVIMYFLMIRPQQKKEKDRKNMVNSLKNGDKVVTAGGIHGTVSAVKEEQKIVVVKVSDNAKIEFSQSAIHRKVTANENGKK